MSFVILPISGCGPTYKDKDVSQAIINLCKTDFKTDVKVKRIGKTLGIWVPVDGLFESTKNLKAGATLDEIFTGIRFTKEASDKIENTSLALTRVALSTDADIDFYVLILADTKGSGIQIVVVRYSRDMRRIMLGDVSRGDYVQRILMDVSFDPVPSAKDTVRRFFYDLGRLPMKTAIARYFSKMTDARSTSPDFFLYLSELDYKIRRELLVKDLKGIQIEKARVLVKCRVKENYIPGPGYENFKFLFPSGTENEYCLLLDTAYMPYLIEQVFLAKSPYPARFATYENPDAWTKEDFFLEDIQVGDFLARQLAGRIRNLYQTDPALRDEFAVNLASGEYQPAKKKFKIALDIERRKPAKPKARPTQALDFNRMWEVVSQVLRRYEYKDYDTVELFNIANAKKEVMSRAELIDKFWPKWLIKSK